MYNIALADDHVLLRNGLASLIHSLGHTVILQADNGAQLVDQLKTSIEPDILLLDINMPLMDGYATAAWIRQNRPLVNVLALSMYDNENAIIRMLRAGAKGYILKDCEPSELQAAISSVGGGGFHHSKIVSGKLLNTILSIGEVDSTAQVIARLTEREVEFLKHCCTELNYKEIAEKMILSPRTIDGYRDSLFEKLKIKTRTGLVLYAIKNGIFMIN